MFFQDIPKAEGYSNLTMAIVGFVLLVLSNAASVVSTYLISRPKSTSEIAKNEAETHKTDAETAKIRADTVSTLMDELDEMIGTVKGLRKEVDTLEDERDGFDSVIKAKDAQRLLELMKLREIFKGERDTILEAVVKLITAVERMIEAMASEGISQDIRMKAVLILEGLYSVRDKLKNEAPDLPTESVAG